VATKAIIYNFYFSKRYLIKEKSQLVLAFLKSFKA